jgi:hypothetical protein
MLILLLQLRIDMADKLCPLLKKNCVEHQCRWYIQVMGKNPQTGQDLSQWGCAIEWLPVLLIENAQVERQTGASVDAFKNEMVNAQRANAEILCAITDTRNTTKYIEG